MPSDIMRWSEKWSAEDHASFEALCFHRTGEVARPYTELMRAPEIENRKTGEEIVKRAYEATKDEIARAWINWDAGKPDRIDAEGNEIFLSGGEIFAREIAKLCDGPGRVAGLVSVIAPSHLDVFECNTMHERGGVLNSTFTAPHGSGAVWDTYWFFEDAFGKENSVSFSTDHLTEGGLAYCLERWPERIEALRKIEEARK
jgi:hypothetical protein